MGLGTIVSGIYWLLEHILCVREGHYCTHHMYVFTQPTPRGRWRRSRNVQRKEKGDSMMNKGKDTITIRTSNPSAHCWSHFKHFLGRGEVASQRLPSWSECIPLHLKTKYACVMQPRHCVASPACWQVSITSSILSSLGPVDSKLPMEA